MTTLLRELHLIRSPLAMSCRRVVESRLALCPTYLETSPKLLSTTINCINCINCINSSTLFQPLPLCSTFSLRVPLDNATIIDNLILYQLRLYMRKHEEHPFEDQSVHVSAGFWTDTHRTLHHIATFLSRTPQRWRSFARNLTIHCSLLAPHRRRGRLQVATLCH